MLYEKGMFWCVFVVRTHLIEHTRHSTIRLKVAIFLLIMLKLKSQNSVEHRINVLIAFG